MDNSSNRPFAVVTGASSGIGLELAREFARNGFDLLVTAEDGGISDAAQNIATQGCTIQTVQTDLADYQGVEKLYAQMLAIGRPLDAIAINAGVGVGGDFAHTDLEAELKLIELNVTSSVHLAKRVVPDMVARRQGKILFTSSIAATMPGPFEAVYAASKAFLLSFSEALRDELKDTGVTVTALMPGPTETNFFHRAGMDDTKVGAGKKDNAAEVAHQGFEALMAGKDKVVAGSFKNKLQATLGDMLPDATKAKIHRSMAEPHSADK